MPTEINPTNAWKMLQGDPGTVLVDIRTSMEFLFVGHPEGAVHIAWMDEPDWDVNPHFVSEVRKLLLGGVICSTDHECANIILICRSGNRSRVAGTALLEAGFQRVFSVDSGFEGELDEQHHRGTINGWRFEKLPWRQC